MAMVALVAAVQHLQQLHCIHHEEAVLCGLVHCSMGVSDENADGWMHGRACKE
jgi:hypothetical protein